MSYRTNVGGLSIIPRVLAVTSGTNFFTLTPHNTGGAVHLDIATGVSDVALVYRTVQGEPRGSRLFISASSTQDVLVRLDLQDFTGGLVRRYWLPVGDLPIVLEYDGTTWINKAGRRGTLGARAEAVAQVRCFTGSLAYQNVSEAGTSLGLVAGDGRVTGGNLFEDEVFVGVANDGGGKLYGATPEFGNLTASSLIGFPDVIFCAVRRSNLLIGWSSSGPHVSRLSNNAQLLGAGTDFNAYRFPPYLYRAQAVLLTDTNMYVYDGSTWLTGSSDVNYVSACIAGTTLYACNRDGASPGVYTAAIASPSVLTRQPASGLAEYYEVVTNGERVFHVATDGRVHVKSATVDTSWSFVHQLPGPPPYTRGRLIPLMIDNDELDPSAPALSWLYTFNHTSSHTYVFGYEDLMFRGGSPMYLGRFPRELTTIPQQPWDFIPVHDGHRVSFSTGRRVAPMKAANSVAVPNTVHIHYVDIPFFGSALSVDDRR